MRSLLAALFLLLAFPVLAQVPQAPDQPWPGQCPSGTLSSAVGCQPQAGKLFPTDTFLGWQPSQIPSTRAMQLQQLHTFIAEYQPFNVKDYILTTDPDATLGINRAIAAAIAVGKPTEIDFPCGEYRISAPINVTTTANQMVWLHGAAANCTVIIQTKDADGIVVFANNVAGYADNGGMRVTGFSLRMNGANSTQRIGLKFSSAALTGQIGALIVVDDIMFQSTGASSLWGTGLLVEKVNAVATWLSHITSVYPNGISDSGLGTAIKINSISPNYSSGVNLRDTYLINGNTGLLIGDFLQGVHVQNLNTVNTKHGLKIFPTVGGQGLMEIHVTDSYIHGQTTIGNPAFPGMLTSVFINTTYFDSIGGSVPDGNVHVAISGTAQIIITNNIFNGPAMATPNVNGLKLSNGGNAFEQVFSNNLFQAYQTGTAITLDNTTKNAMFVGNTLLNNKIPAVVDNGVNNQFASTSADYTPYIWGSGSAAPTAQAWVDGPLNFKMPPNFLGGMNVGPDGGDLIGIYGGAAGSGLVQFLAGGPGPSVSFLIAPKGNGIVTSGGPLVAQGSILAVGPVNAQGPVNNIAMTGSQAGLPVSLTAFGGDTDIGVTLNVKGKGNFIPNAPVMLKWMVVSLLPTCGPSQAGLLMAVNDANAPVYAAPLVGGGSIWTLALCNGLTWTAH